MIKSIGQLLPIHSLAILRDTWLLIVVSGFSMGQIQGLTLDKRFPLLGGRLCSSYGYHQPDISVFICDADNSLSETGARRITDQLDREVWMSCQKNDDNVNNF